MSGIQIVLKTGGLVQTGADTFGYSHLSFQYRGGDTIPTGVVAGKIYRLTSIAELIALNTIYENPVSYSDSLVVYHIKDFFVRNPTGLLYITIFEETATDSDIAESFDNVLDSNKGGNPDIQLFGVNTKAKLDDTLVGMYNAKAEALQLQNSPIYVVVTGYLEETDTLPDFSTLFSRYVGVDVCQDFTENSKGLSIYEMGWKDENEKIIKQCGATGLILGAISSVSVHVNIGWTSLGALNGINGGWSNGGFCNGTKSNASNALNDALSIQGLIFVRYYNNQSGLYFAGFRSGCSDTDDYRTGNVMRVANKIISISQKTLFPYLNSPAYSDPTTGLLGDNALPIQNRLQDTLDAAMITPFTGNDVEVSGIKVFIDSNQNVLATKVLTVEVVFVPVGTNETIKLIVSASNTI